MTLYTVTKDIMSDRIQKFNQFTMELTNRMECKEEITDLEIKQYGFEIKKFKYDIGILEGLKTLEDREGTTQLQGSIKGLVINAEFDHQDFIDYINNEDINGKRNIENLLKNLTNKIQHQERRFNAMYFFNEQLMETSSLTKERVIEETHIIHTIIKLISECEKLENSVIEFKDFDLEYKYYFTTQNSKNILNKIMKENSYHIDCMMEG